MKSEVDSYNNIGSEDTEEGSSKAKQVRYYDRRKKWI
jgi:hypothetical protein